MSADRELSFTTDDYDAYEAGRETTAALPGTPAIDESGHLVIPTDDYYFPPTQKERSMMDPDPDHVGPVTDFWSNYPILIDKNGYIYEGTNENTGMNIRGPAGVTIIKFDDLTEEQKSQIKGRDGAPGTNGKDGTDGINGKDGTDAYHLWLIENGYTEEDHPIDEFWEFLANIGTDEMLVKESSGEGSLLLNYRGARNVASGNGALATGNATQATGNYSSSFGSHTSASRQSSMTIGQYNIDNPNNLFTIGNGTENIHKNILEVNYAGNLKTTGEITDGNNNQLSNKVDKITGKSLSTNDFTNSYKQFLDSYSVDTALDATSTNPVQNKAIYEAIHQVQGSDNVTQIYVNNDKDMVFLSPTVQQSGLAGPVEYQNKLKFNPSKRNLLLDTVTIHNYILSYGDGLSAAANNQTIFGTYNDPDEDAIFQIGSGDIQESKNALNLTKDGDLDVLGEIIDGSGNKLSDMQVKLTYDTEPTQLSTNLVNSGDLYDYLVTHGINPNGGIIIPELDALRTEVASLRAEVADLRARVEACEAGNILTDDTTQDQYKLGVNNGEVYVTLYQQYNPPVEEEQGEDDGDNEE